MSSTPSRLSLRARVLSYLMLLLLIAAGCAPRVDKAAWVVRTNIGSPQGVADICREAREAGFDSLVVQVRGRGDAYYRSTLAPPAAGLATAPAGFDPLAATLDACGPLPVHAWLNVYLLWSDVKDPSHPLHPAQPDFGWFLEDADGRSVTDYSMLDRALGWIEGIYADPASPLYRELFTRIVAEVAQRYPVAGIHLDFVRYPGITYGQGGPLGEQFDEKWGLDARLLPLVGPEKMAAWLAGNLPLHDRVLTTAGLLWAEARAAQITELVRAVNQTLRENGRPVPLSAAVFPEAGAAYLEKGQDWRAWAAAGLVDALYPMAYFGGPERVAGQLQEIQAVQGDGVKLWAGLGGYIKEPAAIATEAAEARRLGFDGVSLFDLGTLMKKPGGSRPYVEAIAGTRPYFAPRPIIAREPAAIAPLAASSSEMAMLKAIAAKAMGGVLPQQPDLDAAIGRRWTEFAAVRPLFDEITAAMAREPQLVPGWIELQGIFRYLNPLDGPAKREEQMAKIRLARTRLAGGEQFATVARELSQGGTKNQGGVLNRRWLTEGSPDWPLAALAAGDLSPVVEVGNGLWCYQLLAKGEPALLPLAEIPWPARRLLFRQHLARALAGK
jgi:uncharacterized lipoprotein YddW (UPF0748 family)